MHGFPRLSSNGYTLSDDPSRMGWLVPSDPGDSPGRLRGVFEEQGYLWLKGILPRNDVLELRARVFREFAEAGLVLDGTDPADGIASPDPASGTAQHRLLTEIVRWAAYESFCLQPAIWRFYEAFAGGPVYLHKRKILRATAPGDPASTGAHYDLTYLRAGTDRVLTSWIPIGDTPVAMGGLMYLEGSDAAGRKLEAEFSVRNSTLAPEERIRAYNKNMTAEGWVTKDLPSLADRLGLRWLVADYEAGDMVVHSATIIHAAPMNDDASRRFRLSTDIRYQRVSDAIDPRWSSHWSARDML